MAEITNMCHHAWLLYIDSGDRTQILVPLQQVLDGRVTTSALSCVFCSVRDAGQTTVSQMISCMGRRWVACEQWALLCIRGERMTNTYVCLYRCVHIPGP